MQLNILYIGDVVGTPGRQALKQALPRVVNERKIDCVIVNAENAVSGSGLNPTLYDKIIGCGVHLITLGDHVYRRKEIIPILEREPNIVRPANLPISAPGRSFAVMEVGGQKVAVVLVLGRLFMKVMADCPYAAMDRVLADVPKDVKIVVVDMHAEATSEKVAMGWYLDGRVSAVVGTHTHIPTADERILPKGTAYITDVGMTGPYDSVLGREKEFVVRAMTTSVPAQFTVAQGDPRMCGVVVGVDTDTGRAVSIERISIKTTVESAP